MIYGSWKELLPIIIDLLVKAADHMSDPPEEYQGEKRTARGNLYTIRKIPNFIPFKFSITVDVPEDGTVVFVRENRFDDPAGMERLIAHEERHVDQWAELGWPEFVLKYARHGGRLKLEADGYVENLDWQVKNGAESPIEGLDKIEFWALYYAAKVDQTYHIRGHGIRDAYNELSDVLLERFGYSSAVWNVVAEFKDEFKPVDKIEF